MVDDLASIPGIDGAIVYICGDKAGTWTISKPPAQH
jgi:hypothetical protein